MEVAKIDCEDRELVLNEIEEKLIEAKKELKISEDCYFSQTNDFNRRSQEGMMGYFPGEYENFLQVKEKYEHLKNKFDTLEKYKSRLVFLQEIKATKEIEEKFNKLFDYL